MTDTATDTAVELGNPAEPVQLGAGEMPPIIYQHKGPMDRGESYWPDTSSSSISRLQRKLEATLSRTQADFILTPNGKKQIRKRLKDKAADKIVYDTGPFTDGSEKVNQLAEEWASAAMRAYQDAALNVIEEDETSPTNPTDPTDDDGQTDPGTDPTQPTQPRVRGAGVSTTQIAVAAGLGLAAVGAYVRFAGGDS